MIKSVTKALRILSILSDAKNAPVSLSEIAKKSGYPKSTCAHLIETLCADGYAIRMSRTEGYVPGPSLFYLTRYGRYKEEFVALCRPIMRWLERSTHTTVVLSVIQSGQKFTIDCADTEQQLFPEHPFIKTDDIYRTATGRAILSHMDLEAVNTIYQKYGKPAKGHWDEVDSYESLLQELSRLRKQSVIQAGNNLVGFACPLFQHGACIGAIGLAWKPSENEPKLSEKTREKLCRTLSKGAKEIQRRLSYETEENKDDSKEG